MTSLTVGLMSYRFHVEMTYPDSRKWIGAGCSMCGWITYEEGQHSLS